MFYEVFRKFWICVGVFYAAFCAEGVYFCGAYDAVVVVDVEEFGAVLAMLLVVLFMAYVGYPLVWSLGMGCMLYSLGSCCVTSSWTWAVMVWSVVVIGFGLVCV